MCGRFTAEYTWAELPALYKLSDDMFPTGRRSNMQPRYNIAPTQDVDFVAHDKGGDLKLLRGRWWLVPFFAKELPKAAMFNARIETVDTSGAFREPFKKRRCLIPADGYFEWTTSLVGGKKDPWLLQLPEGRPFSFAGLCAHNDTSVSTAARSSPRRRSSISPTSMVGCQSSSRRAPMKPGCRARPKATTPKPCCWTTTSTASSNSIASALTPRSLS